MLDVKLEFSVYENGKKSPEYTIESDLNGEVSQRDFLKFLKNSLILIADTVLKEEQDKGFDKTPVIAVDNVIGRSVAEVKPFGKIEITARVQASTIIMDIYKAIIERSPVDTGLYSESNFVFLNGQQIGNSIPALQSWIDSKVELKRGDVIRYVNVMPYAGKLERDGVTSSKSSFRTGLAKDKHKRSGMFVRLPNGTYFLTSRSVARKFKNNSPIKFEWVNGASMDLSGVRNVDKRGRPLRKTFHPKSGRKGSYVYPSIVLRINEEGLL